jgi:glycosyltransferase involved in cell wall biosynthesis
MNNRKIALYAGEIPSSTFIERLIEGLAIKNTVLLFGYQKNKVKYSSRNIKVITYTGKVSKFLLLIKYSFLLMLFNYKDKKKLDIIIRQRSGNQSFLKTKYYPVLYHKPDVFHLQWAKGVAEWRWVQAFGIKYILSLRGTHLTISPYADQKLKDDFITYFPEINGFHAVSEAMKNEVLQYGMAPEKIQVVYSGLDLEKLSFEPKINNKQPNIISIGRNHWVKGYNYALDACKILKNNDFDFKYTIIGIDTHAEELVFQKSDLDLNNCVAFIKTIPFIEVMETLKAADILLLPSTEEGIANVVLEAMAVGTIVLTTNCGGMNEVVVDGQNGFIIPTRNPQAIADKILEISKFEAEILQNIKQNARETIEKQHNFNKMVTQMENLYQIE